MTPIQGKKVLVTGADGFIGSHLVEHLVEEGANVRAVTLYNSFGSWGWLDSIDSMTLTDVEIISTDIRDPAAMRKAVDGVDTVLHLAALISIPFSYESPDSYLKTNIEGTLNILNACREHTPESVVIVSSSEVYGTAQYVPINEDHPLQAQSPYSATKIAAEKLGEAYHRSFGVPVITVRPFNTYGPRQSARAVIPTILTQALSGASSLKLGTLSPTRDFNYVEDTCRGIVMSSTTPDAVGSILNIGSGSEISIGEIAHLIAELVGRDISITSDEQRVRPAASEVERLLCDNQKIKNLCGWEPQRSLREGLGLTLEWFKENLGHYKSGLYHV